MKRTWNAWFLLCVIGLAACDSGEPVFSPEVHDCATIAGRVTDQYNDLIIHGLREWVSEGIKGVRIHFSYPSETDPETRTKDVLLCTYPYTLENRSDPERLIRLQSVMYGGRYLSERELEFLNTSPFRPEPIFDLKD